LLQSEQLTLPSSLRTLPSPPHDPLIDRRPNITPIAMALSIKPNANAVMTGTTND
jgi:hypothetical protein